MKQREDLFVGGSGIDKHLLVKDIKELKKSIKCCDQCGGDLNQVVTFGYKVVCSLECAYTISGNKLHVEQKSILDEEPEKKEKAVRERPKDIYGVA